MPPVKVALKKSTVVAEKSEKTKMKTSKKVAQPESESESEISESEVEEVVVPVKKSKKTKTDSKTEKKTDDKSKTSKTSKSDKSDKSDSDSDSSVKPKKPSREQKFENCIKFWMDTYKATNPDADELKAVLAEHKVLRPKEKKPKGPKDPNKPKAAITAYFAVSQKIREDHKKIDPNAKVGVDVISPLWNAMSEDEKKPFKEIAAKDKIRFDTEMEAYWVLNPDLRKKPKKVPFSAPLGTIDPSDVLKISNGTKFVLIKGAAGKKVLTAMGPEGTLLLEKMRKVPVPDDVEVVVVNENDEDSSDEDEEEDE